MIANVLVVDDEVQILNLIKQLLETNGYKCTLAPDTNQARSYLKEDTFDLILCDMHMPGETGLDFSRDILKQQPEAAIVMVTAVDDPDLASTALKMGVYGYIIKPFKPNELVINVTNALHRRDLEIQNRLYQENLEKMVQERTEELQTTLNDLRKAMQGIVHAMVLTIESRDPYTAGHQQRVTLLALALAQEMGLSEKDVEGVKMASLIHDLGKISVPSEILSKPGKLTEIEFRLVKTHPQSGYEILKNITLPWPIAQIVLQHHERLDGSGYPLGLKDKEILLEAKIIGVADVVEAMASHRPYRPALGIEKALEEISQKKGLLYDSKVVDTCIKLFTEKGFKLEIA
ncbi:MAG TPA: HD domain-containing phosphohydrolase [Thermodesulfobacteriota bacterium]|nr:HD domain-containing phosphohydrolase [Thermodesulfobacteriota bacterium]